MSKRVGKFSYVAAKFSIGVAKFSFAADYFCQKTANIGITARNFCVVIANGTSVIATVMDAFGNSSYANAKVGQNPPIPRLRWS